MNANRDTPVRIAEEAAEWLRVMKSAGAKERVAFTEWLQSSPLHVRELLMMSALDRALEDIDPERQLDIEKLMASASANVVRLPGATHVEADAGGQSSKRWRWLAAAASILALAVAAFWISRPPQASQSYVTAVGEQRTFELNDGSVVYLNTQSRVDVDFSAGARELRLVEGEALFKVHHDPQRPFRVRTDDAVIQAVGTRFNVYRREQGTMVAVVEGKVRVNDGPVLGAGQEITVAHGGRIVKRPDAGADASVAWLGRRLVFRKDTLADIAAEFNRYNAAPQLQVEGERLRNREFNGVFDADDPETLLRYLQTDPGIAFDREGDRVIIRERRN